MVSKCPSQKKEHGVLGSWFWTQRRKCTNKPETSKPTRNEGGRHQNYSHGTKTHPQLWKFECQWECYLQWTIIYLPCWNLYSHDNTNHWWILETHLLTLRSSKAILWDFILFMICLFIFILCASVLCLHVYLCESVWSPRTGGTNSHKLSCGC